MIDFENISLCDMEKYIGKNIYIVHPGYEGDAYWGSIDAELPHLLHKVIKGFYVSSLGLEIITNYNRYDSFLAKNYKIYFNKESAKDELGKLLKI